MTDFLGLSIGMTNLVAARVGAPPVTRRAVLTVYPDRAPEVGVENPNLTEPGVVLSGFVERVGDPVPLVASDGSSHSADRLLVEALDAMTHTVADAAAPSQVAIAVPAHWGPAVLGALRAALRAKPNLSPNGVPPALVSDAVAALAALNTSPGLPDSGIVALLDFGGSGTSITLADAANNFQPVDETLRFTEFSGAQIDQALLTHVLADIYQSSNADTASTAAVGALGRLREQCRQAKERLSAETATDLSVELPGYHSDIRVTRAELESVISGPLAGVLGVLDDMLQRNRIPAASLSAVATVGGGAAIPLITQRLSEHFRLPVVTTPQPALNAAAGAALLAAAGPGADAPTGLAPAAADGPVTGMATAAWAANGPSSATFRALAWSDEPGSDEPVPYTGADYTAEPAATSARPQMEFQPPEEPRPFAAEEPVAWYRRPQVLFAAALAAVVLLSGGLWWTLTSASSPIRSIRTHTATAPATTNPETPGAPLTETVTFTGTDGSPTVVTPATTTSETTSTTSATTTPSTTTTTTTLTTTTTTQPPTTTTTTRPPTTTTTTQAPPTTTQAPPTTTQAPPTTTQAPPTTSAAFTTPQTITTVPVTTVPPIVTSPQPAAASAE